VNNEMSSLIITEASECVCGGCIDKKENKILLIYREFRMEQLRSHI
jgi:hypothetical protein